MIKKAGGEGTMSSTKGHVCTEESHEESQGEEDPVREIRLETRGDLRLREASFLF